MDEPQRVRKMLDEIEALNSEMPTVQGAVGFGVATLIASVGVGVGVMMRNDGGTVIAAISGAYLGALLGFPLNWLLIVSRQQRRIADVRRRLDKVDAMLR
jgi:hypothetical protein